MYIVSPPPLTWEADSPSSSPICSRSDACRCAPDDGERVGNQSPISKM